ncbi:hypothetical protein ACHT8Q_06270 [Stutzerimonas degradans]
MHCELKGIFMQAKVTVPFWSVDAFLYFLMPRSYVSEWSSELISRVSIFIDAYVLHEKIVLPERYAGYEVFKQLDPDGVIFEFIPSSSLNHSDNLTRGVTLDLSLNMTNLQVLMRENYKWYSQHDGYLTREQYESLFSGGGIPMAFLRLWQLGLVNEIADITSSSIILPLSLQGLENNENKRELPFHLSRLSDLDDHFQKSIKSITAIGGDTFSDYLNNVPPLFTLFVDQTLSQDHAAEVIKGLRKDYSALRLLSYEYKESLEKAGSVRDKKDVIEDWNRSWDSMLKGDFRKPQFLRRKISSSDVSKFVVKPESAGLSTIIQAYLEYREEKRYYKRFKIYGELYNELDGISGSRRNLESKFSINLTNELTL